MTTTTRPATAHQTRNRNRTGALAPAPHPASDTAAHSTRTATDTRQHTTGSVRTPQPRTAQSPTAGPSAVRPRPMHQQPVQSPAGVDATTTRTARRSANTEAVTGFISGLAGLVIGNLILGPLAIALGVHALRGGATRRVRAGLAIGLGLVDIALFVVLAVTGGAAHGLLTWHFSGH